VSRRLRYTTAAKADLGAIASHFARQTGDPDIGLLFTDRLDEQCVKLASLPGTLGTERPELGSEIRSTPSRDYIIFFRYDDDGMQVVNILGGRRDLHAYFDA
jgi:toxin ParE1/3/4